MAAASEPNKRSRKGLWLSLAGLHLILVTLGAVHMQLPQDHRLRAVEALLLGYGVLSGSNYGYGYFAPEISGDVRARFQLTDAHGAVFEKTIDSRSNREARLRIGNIVGLLPQTLALAGVRRQVARSWAATFFTPRAGLRKVTVFVEDYDLPTMAEWRAGRRGGWRPLYRASFVPRRAR